MGIAGAPEDLDILEFALKWQVNPQELRERWTIRDMLWLQVVEEAKALAAPEIQRRAVEKAARTAKHGNANRNRKATSAHRRGR